MNLLLKLYSKLSKIIYHNKCIICSSVLSEDNLICVECASWKVLKEPLCKKCSLELSKFSVEKYCSRCKNSKYNFNKVYALIRYDDYSKKILHCIKFKRNYRLLNVFDEDLQRYFGVMCDEFIDSYIVFVPLSFKRRYKRGFNQAELIALKVSKILHRPILKNVLKRTRDYKAQSFLDRNNRIKNVQGAFKCLNTSKIKGKNILLIDDIFTTGSTTNECAKVLKENGANIVNVFALARA